MTAIEDLQRGWTLRADALPVQFSHHLVARMSERLGRELAEATVRRELSKMLSSATVTSAAPDWYVTHSQDSARRTVGYLRFGDDAIVPLIRGRGGEELVGTTLLTPDKQVSKAKAKPAPKRNFGKSSTHGVKRRKLHTGRPPDGPRQRDWGTEE